MKGTLLSSPKQSNTNTTPSSSSTWGTILTSPFSILPEPSSPSTTNTKPTLSHLHGWMATVRRVMGSGTVRRWKESMTLGNFTCGIINSGNSSDSSKLCGGFVIDSNSDIWLLGVCYKVEEEEREGEGDGDGLCSGLKDFFEDFSSRIMLTYRKGFAPFGDSKYASDSGWGCMLRSSQMLLAQALIVHRFGRSWRITENQQMDEGYLDILHEFGDSDECTFSLHKLLEAGKSYGLAAGSWIGPYAVCRAWETLARCDKEEKKSLSMAVFIVSGDEDGERGGAPVLYVEDVSSRCQEYSAGQTDSTAVLLLVPLVLGLDKLNPRYVPLLRDTFAFPQSVGLVGGKSGVSTYIVGVQDEKAFYLDPHETQSVVTINKDDLETDTSSYHCNVVRHLPLESIDPSLAIGFYCKDKDDFDDFCSRATKLAEDSNGAPLFTVANCRSSKSVSQSDIVGGSSGIRDDDSYDMLHSNNTEGVHEDDWQLL